MHLSAMFNDYLFWTVQHYAEVDMIYQSINKCIQLDLRFT